jgi:hypothetical protein
MEVVPNDSNDNDEKKEYDSECDICDVSSDENDDNVDHDENEPVGLSDLDFIANSVGEGEVLWSSQTGKSEINEKECSINNDENALIIVDTNGHMSEEDKSEAESDDDNDNDNDNENEVEVESSDNDSDSEDVIDIKRRTKESKLAHKWYV